MSVQARKEQENGDRVDCWGCGNPLTGNEPLDIDDEGYTYHVGCKEEPEALMKTQTVVVVQQLREDKTPGKVIDVLGPFTGGNEEALGKAVKMTPEADYPYGVAFTPFEVWLPQA